MELFTVSALTQSLGRVFQDLITRCKKNLWRASCQEAILSQSYIIWELRDSSDHLSARPSSGDFLICLYLSEDVGTMPVGGKREHNHIQNEASSIS